VTQQNPVDGAARQLHLLPRQQDPSDTVFSDYLQRGEIERSITDDSAREPRIFYQLIRARVPRRIRKLVGQSRWLRRSRVGSLLWEEPEALLAIRDSGRFPKSQDKQVEFLARSFAGILCGYTPLTGEKYLAYLVKRCRGCREKPAVNNSYRTWPTDYRRKTTLPMGEPNHSEEQCRYSTWPCAHHHPTLPTDSDAPWCGEC
jgi:hypothetical protein